VNNSGDQTNAISVVFSVIVLLFFSGSYTNAQQSQQDPASADGSTTIQETCPILFWQGSNADSEQLLKGRVASPNLEIIKAKLVQLD
jgi:hypothetical protein